MGRDALLQMREERVGDDRKRHWEIDLPHSQSRIGSLVMNASLQQKHDTLSRILTKENKLKKDSEVLKLNSER